MRGIVAFACVLGLLAAAGSAGAEATPFASMAWLEGRWTGISDGLHMEEHWTSPTGDGLVGMHKDVKAGKMVSFEFFRIVSQEDGIYYMTSPGGVPATPFKLIEQSARRLVFENAEHDFPQRILYWSEKPGELRARIEGAVNGKQESMEWRWQRARR